MTHSNPLADMEDHHEHALRAAFARFDASVAATPILHSCYHCSHGNGYHHY